MYYRLLHLTLVLTVVASSLLAGVPCFCAEMLTGPVEVVDEEGDAHDCCAGYVAEEAPEPDCPQCASGTCDEMASMTSEAQPMAPLFVPSGVPAFTLAHASGPPMLPVSLQGPPPPPRVASVGVVRPAQDTYALNRVIRC